MQKRVSVFYYRGYGAVKLPEDIPKNSVFVLDNPPDTLAFKRFLYNMIDKKLTLILGARKNEWNLLKQSLNISGRDIQEIRMEKLTEKEAGNFAECIFKNLYCSKGTREIKEIFQSNSYGFLYAAMLMAVNNTDSLEEIAHQIIGNLSQRSSEGLRLLARIVLSEHYGVKFVRIQFKQVCRRLRVYPEISNCGIMATKGGGKNGEKGLQIMDNIRCVLGGHKG